MSSNVKKEAVINDERSRSSRSSLNDSYSHSSSSDSSKSGDWTDEESKVPSQVPNVTPTMTVKQKRIKAPRRFISHKDYNRFDRPDMFVNKMFQYMGMHLAPDSSRNPLTLQAFNIQNRNSKIVRISVEGGVVATGAELFGSLQRSISENEDQSKLPLTMNIKGQSLTLDYAPPHGDELHFGTHTQDSSWIGPNFLGTVFVSPSRLSQQPQGTDLSRVHDWQSEWSYRSWHRPRPCGTLEPPPPLPSLPTQHVRKSNPTGTHRNPKTSTKMEIDT